MASEDTRQMNAEVRKVVKNAFDRGVDTGRKLGRQQGIEAAKEDALVSAHIDQLEASVKGCTDEATIAALKEAISILEDLKAEKSEGPKEIQRKASSG